MNYQEFLDYIKENIAVYFDGCLEDSGKESRDDKEGNGEGYVVAIHPVMKNNGIVLDGLTIRKPDENCCPNIYLNPYFDQYQMGKPVSVIMEELVCQYREAKLEQEIMAADLTDYQEVKGRIILRLVNYERNKAMLKNCPYKRYMDLAVTFRYMAGMNSAGIATSLISNQEFAAWNVGLEELYKTALFNTMREFPWRMESLVKVLADCLKNAGSGVLPERLLSELEDAEEKGGGVNMYVLTNSTGINGATCILYDNVIKNFASVQDSNIFILPSSVHEVMLVPENADVETNFLEKLVREANDSSVGLIDLLSDRVYYYDREQDLCRLYDECR